MDGSSVSTARWRLTFVKVDPLLKNLRQDRRFVELLKKMQQMSELPLVFLTGKKQRPFRPIVANSEARHADGFGVPKLALRSDGYYGQFIPEAGKTFSDSGSGNCH
jgi:hypothetical protein